MGKHRLYAGTALILAAAGLQTFAGGSWALALLVTLGILLVLTSYGPEGVKR